MRKTLVLGLLTAALVGGCAPEPPPLGPPPPALSSELPTAPVGEGESGPAFDHRTGVLLTEELLGVPLYPEAGQSSSTVLRYRAEGGMVDTVFGHFLTRDSRDEVQAFYSEKLPDAEVDTSTGEPVIGATVADGAEVSITLGAREGGGVTIQIRTVRRATTDADATPDD